MRCKFDLKGKVIACFFLLTIVVNPISVSAQRGCCSRHGGVAGCNEEGRTICKDGTLSPSCTCTPKVKVVYGCTDKEAKNYNSKATKDNGKCEYYVYGCTDKTAKNYNSKAEKDDGKCEYYKYGCTNKDAENYDSLAEKDDGTCIIKSKEQNVSKENKSDKEKSKNENLETNEETDPLDVMLGLFTWAGIGTGVYYYKTKKKK